MCWCQLFPVSVVSVSLPPSLLLWCLIRLSFSVPPLSVSLFLFPLWHLISLWVDPPHSWVFTCTPLYPFLFHCISIHPFPPYFSPSPLPHPPFLVLCDHTFGVFCGSVCMCVSLCSYSSGGEGNNVAVPSVYVPCLPCLVFFSLSFSFFSPFTLLKLSPHLQYLHVASLSWQGFL